MSGKGGHWFAGFGIIFAIWATPAQAITNGVEADCDDYRYDAVGVLDFNDGNMGGSLVLIAPDVVLFAGHEAFDGTVCSVGCSSLHANPLSAIFRRTLDGECKTEWYEGYSVEIIHVIPCNYHFFSGIGTGDCEGTTQDNWYDVCIGILATPVTHIRPVTLDLEYLPSVDEWVTIAGWGYASCLEDAVDCGDHVDPDYKLRHGDVEIVDTDSKYIRWGLCCDGMGHPTGLSDARHNDSGGAALVEGKCGELRLVGIIQTPSGALATNLFPSSFKAVLGQFVGVCGFNQHFVFYRGGSASLGHQVRTTGQWYASGGVTAGMLIYPLVSQTVSLDTTARWDYPPDAPCLCSCMGCDPTCDFRDGNLFTFERSPAGSVTATHSRSLACSTSVSAAGSGTIDYSVYGNGATLEVDVATSRTHSNSITRDGSGGGVQVAATSISKTVSAHPLKVLVAFQVGATGDLGLVDRVALATIDGSRSDSGSTTGSTSAMFTVYVDSGTIGELDGADVSVATASITINPNGSDSDSAAFCAHRDGAYLLVVEFSTTAALSKQSTSCSDTPETGSSTVADTVSVVLALDIGDCPP